MGDLFNVITLGKVTKEFRESLKFILEHGVCGGYGDFMTSP